MKIIHITDYDDTISPVKNSKRLKKKHLNAYSAFINAHREIISVISSGRPVNNVIDMAKLNKIPVPNYIIGADGCEIYNCEKKEYISEWSDYLEQKSVFDTEKVKKLLNNLSPQPECQQRPYKVCFFMYNASKDDIDAIHKKLWDNGIEAETVYSSRAYLDVIPTTSGKGHAGVFLAKYLKIPLEYVAISGDSYNDADMFIHDFGIKIAPKNIQKDLYDTVKNEKNLYIAKKKVAFGTIEGLEFFLKKHGIYNNDR